MLQLLPGAALFIFCVYSFFREVRMDRQRILERDRLGDQHMLREIEKFLKDKHIEKF